MKVVLLIIQLRKTLTELLGCQLLVCWAAALTTSWCSLWDLGSRGSVLHDSHAFPVTTNTNKQSQTQNFVFSASESVAGYFVSLLENSLLKKKNSSTSVWTMAPGKEGEDGSLWARLKDVSGSE